MEKNNDIDFYYQFESKSKYFKLSSYKIVLLAMIIALNLILSIISVWVFQWIAIIGFLRIEISFITYLICWKTINGFYAMLIITPCTWMRYMGFDPNVEPVGLLSMNLSDLFIMGCFILFAWVFTIHKSFKNVYVKIFIISLIICLIGSLFNILLNFTFLLDLYSFYFGVSFDYLKSWWYAGILTGYVYLKYMINLIMFISIYKVLNIISKNDHHNNK
ncbi:hypothetical protein [Spiroplasma culicicola]|uniref:Uncharacterized protein n=1 Tax=Spiroplasma culicicola AES-1 TaxID=1276246 RepID=W6A703_9MOLU|nr:hypothetical protein [Spiroplasma culicicola]AHI52655.1 hypothetical protein SCULI_v1c03140 [Spiroplasma culicicola AES-1]